MCKTYLLNVVGKTYLLNVVHVTLGISFSRRLFSHIQIIDLSGVGVRVGGVFFCGGGGVNVIIILHLQGRRKSLLVVHKTQHYMIVLNMMLLNAPNNKRFTGSCSQSCNII